MRKHIVLFVLGIGLAIASQGCDASTLERLLVGSSRPTPTPAMVKVSVNVDGDAGCCERAGTPEPDGSGNDSKDDKVPVTVIIDPTSTPGPTIAPTATPTVAPTEEPAPEPTPEWHGVPVPEGEWIPPVLDLDGVWDRFTFENDQRTIAQRAFLSFHGNAYGGYESWYSIEWGDGPPAPVPDPLYHSFMQDEYFRTVHVYNNGYLNGKVVCVIASGSHRVRRHCGTLRKVGASYQPDDWTVEDVPPYKEK